MNAKEAIFKNLYGHTVDGSSAVVPLVSQNRNTNEVFFIGTAFFISAAGILMTAKHNLFDKEENLFDNLGVYQFFPDNKFILRPIRGGSYSGSYDIAYLLPEEVRYKNETYFGPALTLTNHKPDLKEQLGMFGYPESRVTYEVKSPAIADFNSKFFLGTCVDYHPGGFSLLKNPCYQTNIKIPSGASGGPVFDKNGYVFAVASTGFDLSDGGEDISFVTPVAPSFDLMLTDGTDTSVSVKDLITRQIINFM